VTEAADDASAAKAADDAPAEKKEN